MNTVNTIRINITVPRQLLVQLADEIPLRGKSKFISEAIEEKLLRKKQDEAFATLHDAPPAFPKIKDAAAYVRQMRRTDDALRTKAIHA